MESMPQHRHDIVGREAELSRMKECLARAMDGDGSTILVSGEAGIGKTRLLEEFVSFTATQKVEILSGTAAADTIHGHTDWRVALSGLDLHNVRFRYINENKEPNDGKFAIFKRCSDPATRR